MAHISGSVHNCPNLTLYYVLYMPSFHVNLISIPKLELLYKYFVQFNSNTCHILHNNTKVMTGIAKMSQGIYVIDTSSPKNSSLICKTSASSLVWHYRLGNISNVSLHAICKYYPFISNKNAWNPCDAFHYAKQKKLPFPLSTTISHAHFEWLHGDLWGPFSTTSILGHRYFLTLVYDFSRFTWVIFIKTKDETRTKLINFIAYIENQFHTTLKCLRTDNST